VSHPSPIDRIDLLEKVFDPNKTWGVLAPQYGVTNENPPWKSSLSALCGCIGSCEELTALEIRHREDSLADSIYRDVPTPERQLLALAHTMIERGIISEDALADRMERVRARLEDIDPEDSLPDHLSRYR